MKTIILPGYSLHNRDWAYEIKDKLGVDVLVHEWRHWKNPGLSLSIRYETDEIKKEIAGDKVNIIAKSVGVAVAMELIPQIAPQVDKVILCGIASVSGSDRADSLRNVLEVVPPKRILCIQNEKDKFVIYRDAEAFYHSADPNLKVVSKPRSDHEYPYFEDFKDFFSG